MIPRIIRREITVFLGILLIVQISGSKSKERGTSEDEILELSEGRRRPYGGQGPLVFSYGEEGEASKQSSSRGRPPSFRPFPKEYEDDGPLKDFPPRRPRRQRPHQEKPADVSITGFMRDSRASVPPPGFPGFGRGGPPRGQRHSHRDEPRPQDEGKDEGGDAGFGGYSFSGGNPGFGGGDFPPEGEDGPYNDGPSHGQKNFEHLTVVHHPHPPHPHHHKHNKKKRPHNGHRPHPPHNYQFHHHHAPFIGTPPINHDHHHHHGGNHGHSHTHHRNQGHGHAHQQLQKPHNFHHHNLNFVHHYHHHSTQPIVLKESGLFKGDEGGLKGSPLQHGFPHGGFFEGGYPKEQGHNVIPLKKEVIAYTPPKGLPPGPPVFYAPSPDVKMKEMKKHPNKGHGHGHDGLSKGPYLKGPPISEGEVAIQGSGIPLIVLETEYHEDHPTSKRENKQGPQLRKVVIIPLKEKGRGGALEKEQDDAPKVRRRIKVRRRRKDKHNYDKNYQHDFGTGTSREEQPVQRRRKRDVGPVLVDDLEADGTDVEEFWKPPPATSYILFDRYKQHGDSHEDSNLRRNKNGSAHYLAHDSNSEEQRFFPSFPAPYLGLSPFGLHPSPARGIFPGPSSATPSRPSSSRFNPFRSSSVSNRGPSSADPSRSAASHMLGSSGDRYQDSNLLGSGNFEVVRGGTYYGEDDDHGPSYSPHHNNYQGSPYDDDDGYYGNGHSSPYRGGGGGGGGSNDFFANFRDFADINPHSRAYSTNSERKVKVNVNGHGVHPHARGSSRKRPNNILEELETASSTQEDLQHSNPSFRMDYLEDPLMATY